MRSVVAAATRIVVLACATVVAGCGGGPESGTQVKVTDEEVQKRTQGIKDAMKAGMYSTPPPPPAKGK
jgi:hypothetical protein